MATTRLMIRRETKNGWIIFNQDDHARLASDIMKNWGNSYFPNLYPYEEVLFAIAEHDSGWRQWDSNPRINPENRYPANFMEMDITEQHIIWRDCFTKHSGKHRYASALIALHFSKFNYNSLKKVPGNGKAKNFKNEINKFVSKMLDIDYHDSGSNLPRDVQINLRMLQVGDVISLALCHGWESTVMRDVPDRTRQGTDIILKSENGADYTVSQYPFSTDELEFRIRGRKLSKKTFTSSAELKEDLKNTAYEYFYYTISKK